ncbi:MAG: TPM domain-containing protein [Clostridiales bacterium]|nr:TPM domain-containing protein [Clostridiales bacterium]
MKKRLSALLIILALLLAALPAMASSIWTADFDAFFDGDNAAEDSKSSDSLVIIDRPRETQAVTQAPVATEEPAPQPAENTGTTPYGQRIFDDGNLLSPAEEAKINQQITQFQKETGMDFVVVTYNGPLKKATAQDEADVFYEEGCAAGILGNVEPADDDEDSGMLIYINPGSGDYAVSTTGKMIDYITDERASSLDYALRNNLSAARHTNNYAQCVTELISGTTRYVKEGIPEGAFQYDVHTGQMLTAPHKALTGTEMLVSGGIGLVVCLIFVFSVKGNYNLKRNTYEYSVRNNSSLRMTRHGDQYIRSSVNRVRRPDNRSSGGGFGGGGFSGGSGVHTSSGGGSHGGFSGKF